MPQVLSGVVIGVIWTWIYAVDGSLNEFLRAIGLGALAKPWLGDFTWALPAVGMIGAWWGIGLCMVLFVAGIQQIDNGLYDAARVDGAGRIAEFFAITLPSLRYELGVALTLTVIGALRIFDLVFVTTRGGPEPRPRCPGIQLYQRSLRRRPRRRGLRHRRRAGDPGLHRHGRHRPNRHEGAANDQPHRTHLRLRVPHALLDHRALPRGRRVAAGAAPTRRTGLRARAFPGRCTSRRSRRPGRSRTSRRTCGRASSSRRPSCSERRCSPSSPGTPSGRCASAARTGSSTCSSAA